MAESRTAVGAAGRRLLRRGARSVRQTFSARKGLFAYLSILGPGMIAASAGNDAGGIATYASVGADHGYRLLWVLICFVLLLSSRTAQTTLREEPRTALKSTACRLRATDANQKLLGTICL
jgi:hypothetical protein